MSETIDFDAEGMLDGLEGSEREDREALLQRLADDGVPPDELRAAAREGRLAVLPVERLLTGRPRYTLVEIAERSGVPVAFLERQLRSVGSGVPGREEKAMSNDDLEAAHRQRALLDSGLDEDQIVELSRTIAVAMSQFAAASRQIMAAAFVQPDDTEREFSERLTDQTRALVPLVGPSLEYVYKMHLREQLNHAVFDAEGGEAGETVAIAFADLVGFTRLGE
jgi:adenylate cyclase